MIDAAAVLALVSDDDLVAECLRRGIGTVARTPSGTLWRELRRRTEYLVDEPGHAVVAVGGLVVDPVGGLIEWRGDVFSLTGRPLEVLYTLAVLRAQGRRVVPAETLGRKVWPSWDETRPLVRVAVYEIRREIPGLIGSTPRHGYSLKLIEAKQEAAA